jgi:DNA mismatch endonuclease, patch repair protein
MADSISKKQRSYNMSQIRSKGNFTTERIFASLLRSAKIKGWRRHVPLPGKPDFVFAGKKTIVFVDGCFWHHHRDCVDGKIPRSRREYWKKKLLRNVERDMENILVLRKMGWKVIRFWECEMLKKPEKVLRRTKGFLLKEQRASPSTCASLR